MRCIRSGVYRYITGPPLSRAMNILVDKEFLPANKMFEARCKSYVREGNPKPKHYPSIGEGDMKKIMTYLKPYESPTKLVQYVWFMLAFNLARRGREGWTNMTKSSFEYKSDDNEEEYLTMSASETTKNWQGGSSSNAWDYSDVRIHASNKLDPPKNFLAVYRFYLSKLNPDCDKLFQRPKGKNWSKDGFWFDKAPMGKNTIGSMLSSISKSAGTSIVYTNHSVRATAITAMYQAGIDRSHICRITKHKREESLKPYISEPSSEQKRTCSTVLQQHLGLADSNESHPEAMISTETDTNSGIMRSAEIDTNPVTRPVNQTLSLTENSVVGIPTGAGLNFTFTGGNFVFNINSQSNKQETSLTLSQVSN